MTSDEIKKPFNAWIGKQKPNARASVRLFCFPYAGGSANIYRAWPNILPHSIEVYSLNLPGRGVRLHEPPFTQIEALVKSAAQAILPYLDKPAAFFGHSMGALISFELIRRLRKYYSFQPAYLFASGRMAPQLNDLDPPTYGLPDDEFIQEIRRLSGTPREVIDNPELMRLMLPTLRADFHLCQTYCYTPDEAIDCPITVFGGLQDYETPRESLEAWSEHTKAAFRLRMLQGDHFFINHEQQLILGALAQDLCGFMRERF